MSNLRDLDTSSGLLERLRIDPTNESAWAAFVGRYGPVVHRWCRRWGLQDADAQDVTQEVLLSLSRQLHRFEPDPGRPFRAWLRTIAHRSWCHFLEERRRAGRAVEGTELDGLRSPEACEDFLDRLQQEGERELIDRARAEVRRRVLPRTWEAFRLMTEERLAGAEVAARLGMNVATVFVARSKVQKMMLEEIRRLDDAGPAR